MKQIYSQEIWIVKVIQYVYIYFFIFFLGGGFGLMIKTFLSWAEFQVGHP